MKRTELFKMADGLRDKFGCYCAINVDCDAHMHGPEVAIEFIIYISQFRPGDTEGTFFTASHWGKLQEIYKDIMEGVINGDNTPQ